MPAVLVPAFWLIVVILAAGIIVWGIRAVGVIDEPFKNVAIVLIVVLTALYALFTVAGMLGTFR